jgi:hypothetical protein
MEMIFQKTVRPCFRDGTNVLPPQIQKVGVISFLKKDILSVIPTIINMIERAIGNGWDISRHILLTDLSGGALSGEGPAPGGGEVVSKRLLNRRCFSIAKFLLLSEITCPNKAPG